jgi:hypothetical protein
MGTARIQHTCRITLLTAALWGAGCSDDDADVKGRTEAVNGFAGPQFPGAGTGQAGASIAAGLDTVTCDGAAGAPGGTQGPLPGQEATATCFYSADEPSVPAAMIEWIVEAAENQELVHVRLTLNPAFVDNTYGANAIGWGTREEPMMPGLMPGGMGEKPPKGPKKGGHTFKDLVGSDHAEFKLYDHDAQLRLHFKLDYLSEADAPSGYASLGVVGGEGKMLLGVASDVVAASSSLDRNLNACGMGGYLEDSPATDENYTPLPAAKLWDYRVVYDVWVKQAAFGAAGFGSGVVDFVHASPSKLGENSVDVTPKDCPPSWPYCNDPDGCPVCESSTGCVPEKPEPEPCLDDAGDCTPAIVE